MPVFYVIFFSAAGHGRNAVTESLVEAASGYFSVCYVIIRMDIIVFYVYSERVLFVFLITCRVLLSIAVAPPTTGASR